MILAQAAALGVLWLLLFGFFLYASYGGMKDAGFDDGNRMVADALVLMIQDEQDAEHIRTQAKRIQFLDEKHTLVDSLHPGEYRARYQVLDAQGRMIFHSPFAPAAPYTDLGPGFHMVRRDGEGLRVLVQDSPNGRLRVQVAESLALRRRIMWRNLEKSPITILIIFAPIALFTWLVSRRVLRPLKRLAEAVEARPPGDLRPLEPPFDIKETRPLVAALNCMFQNISELLETQRRFVADAAHSLRTPLAVLGAQIHALQCTDEPAQRVERSEALQRGLERAAAVVHQLLSVARLDGAEPVFHKTRLDLGRLARERLALLVPLALAKEQDPGVEGPERLEAEGDPAILATVLDNLLENAIKYTPRGGILTLRLREDAQWTTVEVEDNGPGMSEEFQPHAFERFARDSSSEEPGAGLGLSIVARAVELHGGQVSLHRPSSGRGLLVRILLPRALPFPC